MSAVEVIGQGYYAIVTDGVSVDRQVAGRIDEAFQRAAAVPAEKLVIHPVAAEAQAPATGFASQTQGSAPAHAGHLTQSK